jgi:hypothetical protein
MIASNCSTYGNSRKQLRRSSPSLEELEKGFSDWVRKLRSILQKQNSPLINLSGKKQPNQKGKQLYPTQSHPNIKRGRVEKHK